MVVLFGTVDRSNGGAMSDSINAWGGTVTKVTAEPLFVVRRPLWQGRIWQGFGAAIVAVGLIGGLSDVISGKPDGWQSLGFFLFFFGGFGALVVLFGSSLVSSRMNVFDDHLDVRVGFGKYRRRTVDDIATLRFGTQSQGGGPTFTSLTAWNDRRKKQFMVFTGYRGFQELTVWLAERRPEQWADCERAGIPR